MQDFLEFARYHNFEISQPELDGKVHRIRREGYKKEDAWYIGSILHTTRGDPFVVATIGDWKTGERFKFKSETVKFSREDIATVLSQQKLQSDKVKKETDEKNEEAKKYAATLWSSARKEIDHPYFAKKQLSGNFGIKQLNNQLLIPCRFANGQLAGLQRIFEDGSKRFLSGQKTNQTFHMIGDADNADIMYLAEGFATGASIHMATEKPVAIAFSANNLLNIAKVLKEIYDCSVVVCGDDDRFTEGNPGKSAAEKCAAILGTVPLLPIFSDEDKEKKLTDFNDVHVQYGIDELINQLTIDDVSSGGFVPLGYTTGEYYFYLKETSSIVRISSGSEMQMFSLAPREYWEGMFANEKGKINWEKAKDDIIQQCKKFGVYDPSKIRGCGVWIDRGRVIVNTGKQRIVNGQRKDEFESSYVYIDTRNKIEFSKDGIATTDELIPLVEILKLIKFKNKNDWKLLIGWLAIARIAGALPIRPHIWITGGAGTGKSTLFENIISPMLGSENGKISARGGGSTEAGIRQSVAADAIPVILDEFEMTGNKGHDANVEAIIDLMRQSWSTTGSKILKGSPAGVVMEYSVAFAALVSSIRVCLNSEADRGRFSILELENHGSNESEWQDIVKHLEKINEELGERLFARSIKMARTILSSYDTARGAISSVSSQREGQQLGMLIAGYHSVVSDDVISYSDALDLYRDYLPKDTSETNDNTRDEYALLDHILTTRVDVSIPNGDKQDLIKKETIGAMIENEIWAAQLPTYGIMITAKEIRIANAHAELAKILRGTPWSKNWGRTLGRLPGAIAQKPCGWTFKTTKKCTTIPLSILES